MMPPRLVRDCGGLLHHMRMDACSMAGAPRAASTGARRGRGVFRHGYGGPLRPLIKPLLISNATHTHQAHPVSAKCTQHPARCGMCPLAFCKPNNLQTRTGKAFSPHAIERNEAAAPVLPDLDPVPLQKQSTVDESDAVVDAQQSDVDNAGMEAAEWDGASAPFDPPLHPRH